MASPAVSTALLHALNIAYGLAASVTFAACFYLAGSLVMRARAGEALRRDETPALVGAAVYVLLCWVAVELGVGGRHVALAFSAAVVAGSMVRSRQAIAALGALFSPASRGWWGTFGLLYFLAYLYTMPPVGKEHLPLAWTGNIDLLTYIRYTRYLWDLGQSNLVGFGYLDYVYLQTPGLFYLLGWFSMLFGNDPLSAAMPAQFALVALIGLLAARLSRSVFGLSMRGAAIIACILISAPFFRYVVGAYFLSTLMSIPVLLYLLRTTTSSRPARRFDLPLVIRFGAAYVLLLFIYPFLFFAGIALQCGAIGLLLIAERQEAADRTAWRDAVRDLSRVATAAGMALATVAVILFGRVQWAFAMVTSLSQVGVAGWPLEIISPLAVFGFPGVRGDEIQVETPGLRLWALAAFVFLALALTYCYFWRFRRATNASQKTMVALTAGGILAYCAYYLRIGESYQQWKFATYAVLPFSFVASAAVLHLVPAMRWRQPLTQTSLAGLAAFLIGGNLAVHGRDDRPPIRLAGSLRNIEQVDALPFFREMSLDVRGGQQLFQTYLALYFLPSKRVHVISDVFEPSEEMSFETISRERPLLMAGYGCEGVGHEDAMAIPEVGCLVLAPPSPVPDRPYPFTQSFLFIDPDRMARREPGGRRNTRSVLNIRLTADPQRARVAEDAYVNLSLTPFPEEGTTPSRLMFSWGTGRRGEILVSDREWISLPVRSADWSGDRAWELPISIAFSDDRRVLFHELSVSQLPRGRLIPPSDPLVY